jgi:asparagine N-glycosylation enzyme membrane subunit Stt3
VLQLVGGIQELVLLVATLTLFGLHAWAFVDAVGHSKEAYVACDKQTKPTWLAILGATLALRMLWWDPISIISFIGAVASIVYLVDVRPALRSLTRR